jgi:hypothetical protein
MLEHPPARYLPLYMLEAPRAQRMPPLCWNQRSLGPHAQNAPLLPGCALGWPVGTTAFMGVVPNNTRGGGGGVIREELR